MTEEEAKTKWCPMVGKRFWADDGTISPPTDGKCLASECMAWRWYYRRDEVGRDIRIDSGYCGLAR